MSLLPIQYYSDNPEFTVPTNAYGDDAGYDLYAAETITILPRSCEGVNCAFHMAIPQGYYGKVFSRSGFVKHHLITVEGGVIDSGYRGEIYVFVFNHGKDLYTFNTGAKVAQIVFMKKEKVEFIRVDRLNKLGLTKRGRSGFGSSDLKKVKFEEENKEKDKVIIVEEGSMSGNGKMVVTEKSITIE